MTALAPSTPTKVRRPKPPPRPTILPEDSYQYNDLRSIKHQRAVFNVKSEQKSERKYTVVHEFRTLTWTCDCPATVPECKHIRTVRYWNWWRAAYRVYLSATPDDLRAADEQFLRVLRGEVAAVEGFDAEADALADVIAARFEEVQR